MEGVDYPQFPCALEVIYLVSFEFKYNIRGIEEE